jgi:hypothetical protein
MDDASHISQRTIDLIVGYWLVESVEGHGKDFLSYAKLIKPYSPWHFYPHHGFDGKLFFGSDDCDYALNDKGLGIGSFDLCSGFSDAEFNVVHVTEDHLVITGQIKEDVDRLDPKDMSANLKINLKRWYEDYDVANILTGVNAIEKTTFSCHQCLKSITIPNSVTHIGDFAFSSCDHLQSIVIPNSVTGIGCYAFSECKNLSQVTLPNSIKIISENTFDGCSSLTKIVLPDSINVIDDYAFYNCPNLSSVIIPNSVNKIGSYAFKGCTSLTSIVIPDSVRMIKKGAFSDCPNLWNIRIKDRSLLDEAGI